MSASSAPSATVVETVSKAGPPGWRKPKRPRIGLLPPNAGIPYLFVGPALLIVIAGLAYPAFHGTLGSFFNTRFGTHTGPFAGLANYREIFSDPFFQAALRRTLVFVLGCIAVTQTLAVSFALILNRLSRRGRPLRTLVLAPYLVSTVAAAELFRLYFNTELGFPNYLLRVLPIDSIQWLGHPRNSMIALIIAFAWLTTPLAMLIVFAGLQAVEPELLEAASVDGANVFQRFWKITVHLISRQLVLALIWISFNAANTFGLILPLTGGGPARATETLAIHMYYTSFINFRHSEAMAIMVVLLGINGILTAVYLRFTDFQS